MHFSAALSVLALAPAALAAPAASSTHKAASSSASAGKAAADPFKYPLANGFPTPGQAALARIQKQAGGSLPNTPLPTQLSAASKLDFQIVAVNEIFEVAFFTSFLYNVTNDVEGFKLPADVKKKAMADLREIRAQEELHAVGANAILKANNVPTEAGCEYYFPSTNYKEAIVLANEFTDLVLGALPAVQYDLATGGGDGAAAIPLVGSILAQEGEQVGAYRLLQNKNPSAAPFLSANSGIFAANALAQMFIVPGSCKLPDVPILDPLMVTDKMIPAKNTTLHFSTTGTAPTTKNYITYISGQSTPMSVPISNIKTVGKTSTFEAAFPFEAGFAKGLTVAALTKTKGPFTGAGVPNQVAMASIAGPGIIEVD